MRQQNATVPAADARAPEKLLPVTPIKAEILRCLADGERHGYGIMLEIRQRAEGQRVLGPSTLYSALKSLATAGLIEDSTRHPSPDQNDTRRRYYQLTDFGAWVMLAEVRRMKHYISQVHSKFPSSYKRNRRTRDQ